METLIVTGGCGFIGSNFINVFFHKYPNIRIVNLDILRYSADLKNINDDIRESKRYIFIKCDITNIEFVSYILNEYNVDYLIHFAAQSHVQNSFEHSLQYTQDNIVGTHVLLEAVRKYGRLKKMIHMSTDEVYGESSLSEHETQKTETSVLYPTNPYAATKAGAELLVSSYVCSFKLPIVIVRCNNVYGLNQYPEKLIPRFITQLITNKKVTIQGDGTNVRGFVHANDVSNAFIILFEKGVNGEIYNIGCRIEDEFTILEIAQMLINNIKHSTDFDKWIDYIEDRPFNDKRYFICCEKIKKLGWKQTIHFHDGIKELIVSYKKNTCAGLDAPVII
jgi:dTDP-glucose 4,6-dehydratase/UDP-glucose 4,6-dehydratase